MTTELDVLPAIIPIDQLAEINATNAALQQLLDRAQVYADLPADAIDKETYKEVHSFVQVAQKTRTSAVKLAKELAAPHQQKADEIMGEGKRIGERAKEAEDLARPIKTAYETKIENERKEREQAAATRLVERNRTLIDLGMVWQANAYTLGEHVIESVDIRGTSDEEWAELLAPVIEKIEADRIEADARRQEQLDKEQKERDRLADQKKEQDAQALELQRQQNELKQAQEKADAIIRKDRTDRLIEAGFDPDERGVLSNDVTQIRPDVILKFSDEQFDTVISDANTYAVRKTDEIAAKLKADEQREKDEKAATAAKLKADKDRTRRLAPDKKLLEKHIKTMIDVASPTLAQPETTELFTAFNDRLNKLVDEFLSDVNGL